MIYLKMMRTMNRQLGNAEKARNSFVTRRAELKMDALSDIFKAASGDRWKGLSRGKLIRTLNFKGFRYLDSVRLVYNWENRFMSVNYNLRILSHISIHDEKYVDVSDCKFVLNCKKNIGEKNRKYSWKVSEWSDEATLPDGYVERLMNPFILDRIDALDIMEMFVEHRSGSDYWTVSCESLIGSATWILIPPVMSMVTPKPAECTKILELYELIGDAVVNNR